jgi:prepilin-type N-terminal cleavage/methylation domain-containing protein
LVKRQGRNTMRKTGNKKGYSLIEILVVMVIIAALSAIAIPMYIGVRERGREASIIASARGSTGELDFWIQSAVSMKDEKEVDTNFSGIIDAGDKSDEELFNDGVANVYAMNRNTILKERSPWDYNVPLWNSDATIPPGRVTLIQLQDNEVRIVAKNRTGSIIFDQIVSAD